MRARSRWFARCKRRGRRQRKLFRRHTGLNTMASTLDLLRRLVEHGVEFVLVGGMAAAAHGASIVTEDVDICIRFWSSRR